MGNAAIYYYPHGEGGLRVIDLGEPLSDVQESLEYVSEGAAQGDLGISRITWGMRTRVRFSQERFTSRTRAQELRSLQTHLSKGLPVSIAADSAKTWAAFASNFTLAAGHRTIVTNGNLFYTYASVLDLAAGDVVVFRGGNPEANWEEWAVDSYTSSTAKIALGSGNNTRYDYKQGPVLIRHQWFWPVMYLPLEAVNQPIVTSDRRYTWTMDMTLVEAPSDYAAIFNETGGSGFEGFAGEGAGTAEDSNGTYTGAPIVQSGKSTLQGAIANGYDNLIPDVDVDRTVEQTVDQFRYSY